MTPPTGTPSTDRQRNRHVNALADDRIARSAALVVRLTAAALWFTNLAWKRPPDFGENDNAGLYFFTKLAVEYPVFQPWSSLVKNVILPNFAFFGWVTLLMESALAILLLLGVLTRLVALVGVVQSLAIFLSVSAAPEEWYWSYLLMAALHLAILAMAAGRVLSVDAVIRSRLGDATGRLARVVRIAT